MTDSGESLPKQPKSPDSIRILVVEDDPINRLFAQKILGKMHCQYACVTNGLEAVDQVRQERFQIILMDCFMPEMDGCEATRQIRRLEVDGILQGQPHWILGITANAVEGQRELCLASGMNDYMNKPFVLRDLRIRLEPVARSLGYEL
jgi:CheY-like chemotaxis protein